MGKPVTKLIKGGRHGVPKQVIDEVRERQEPVAPACLGFKTPGWCKAVRS